MRLKLGARVMLKTPTLSTDGTNGQIQYATIAGDLNQPGPLEAAAVVTLGGNVFYSSAITRQVVGNIPTVS
jgi:hypothetical protein